MIAGLLLSSVLILVGAVLFLGESDYKRLLGWGAERFLDSQLVIEGPIKVDISRNLSLYSEHILLKSNDDSYQFSAGKLHINFRLGSYLRTGTFWFNSLELEDVNLKVMETAEDDDFSFEELTIPPVIVQQAHFKNLVFAYQELPPGTLHTFSLDELTMEELGEHQPVSLRATGLFEGQPFEVQATTDSIAQLVEYRDPQNVQLKLNSAYINASLEGTIADPLNGRGLELRMQIEIPQVRDIIEIAWDETPILGSLRGSLTVRGDYTAPRFEAIDLHLLRGQDVDITVRGSVADLWSGTGLDLQLEGQSSNPEVLSWLLFKKNDRIQAIHVNGRLRRDVAQFSLHDLNASAETADGLKLQVSGSAVIQPEGYRLMQVDAGLAIKFSAPTLALTNILELEEIPELGLVSGSLELALGMDAVAIYSADINIGDNNDSRIMLQGDIGYVQLFEELDLSELNMQVDIQTAGIARLGKQLDYALPALGPARLRGKLVTQGSELLLQGAKLNIGTPGQSTLHATGLLATQLHDPANFRVAMDVDIQATELAGLAEAFGYTLPELGQAHITGWLESKESELLFEDARIVVGAANQPTIRANGRVVTQLKKKGSNIYVEYDVAVSPLVAAFSDLHPRNLGHLLGDAVIADLDGDWGIESFSLVSSQTGLYQFQLSGTYDDLVNYDKAQMNSSLVIDSPVKLGEALGLNLGGLGSFRQQGAVTVKKGHWRYDGKTALGRTNSTTKISGYLKDGKPVLGGSVEIPILYLTDFGFGSARKDMPGPRKDEPASPYVFSREPLNLDFLKEFDFDMVVSIDEVESGALTIDSVKGQLELKNGHLIMPLHLVFEGGNTHITSEIKVLDIPEYRLSIIADDVTLGPLMAQVTEEVPIQGYSNIHLNLHTRGKTPHQMASNLSGDVDLGLENARIPKKYIELLSVDTFGWVMSSTMAKRSHSNLNCVVMTFGVNKGEVKSETIIADGPLLSIAGQIDMDLGEETLNIVLLPRQKKRMFSSVTPVKIHGPMRNPEVSAIPAKAAIAEIGTMTLFSAVFIPLRLGEKLWQLMSDGDKLGGGCANVDELLEASK